MLLSDDNMGALFEDQWLDAVFKEKSRISNEEWRENVLKSGMWLLNPVLLRERFARHIDAKYNNN